MSQWHFIFDKLKENTYRELTLEEFKKVRPNFNIPSLGKFSVTEERFKSIQKRREYLKKLRQNVQSKGDNPAVQSGGNDDGQV